MATESLTMARTVSVFVFMVLLAAIVEGRDWRFEVKRVKRGYNTSKFGSDGYGRHDEQDASVSRERLGCSEQDGGSYGSESRELAYNRDNRSSDNSRRNHSFSKASASATSSATAFNEHHNINI